MNEWRSINEDLSRAYGVRVPAYDLRPVLELIAGVDPALIAQTASECIIMLTDELLAGNRVSNQRSQDLSFVLKMIFRAFSAVRYDLQEFNKGLEEQIANDEGCYASEPIIDYPYNK